MGVEAEAVGEVEDVKLNVLEVDVEGMDVVEMPDELLLEDVLV